MPSVWAHAAVFVIGARPPLACYLVSVSRPPRDIRAGLARRPSSIVAASALHSQSIVFDGKGGSHCKPAFRIRHPAINTAELSVDPEEPSSISYLRYRQCAARRSSEQRREQRRAEHCAARGDPCSQAEESQVYGSRMGEAVAQEAESDGTLRCEGQRLC